MPRGVEEVRRPAARSQCPVEGGADEYVVPHHGESVAELGASRLGTWADERLHGARGIVACRIKQVCYPTVNAFRVVQGGTDQDPSSDRGHRESEPITLPAGVRIRESHAVAACVEEVHGPRTGAARAGQRRADYKVIAHSRDRGSEEIG